MRFAEVKDSVVTMVYESNSGPVGDAVDITGRTDIAVGWVFSDNIFSPPLEEKRKQEDEVTAILEAAKERKRGEIAAARFEAETAGIDVNGFTVRTDRESQALITGAALQAIVDYDYECRWKTSEGFVHLSAEQIKYIAQAVRAHVQSCFDHESELVALVDAAETVEAVEAIVW